MEEILGLRPTGREIRDPAARLVEATDEQERTFTVLCFDEHHRGHAALSLNVELVMSFMEFPMVTGLVGLARHDLASAHFAFGTGSVWTLAEVSRVYQDFGQVVGLRAGLELAWLAAQILVEAGETGPMQGCFSHGNLSPTRIALRADGMVQVFGYGLAQVELMRHREEGLPLEPRSLQHCPPERLEGVPEDAAADTYALTLIVYELITGKPLLDSLDVDELTRMVGMSEGATLLSRSNQGLPAKVAKVFARSLVYDPDTRLSGQDYVDAIGGLLANEALDGPSLAEVVETLQGRVQKGMPKARKLVSTASTTAFTPEMLAAMADDDEDDDDDDDTSAADPRWKKVERGGRRGGDEEEAQQAPSDDAGSSRRRRRGPPEATSSEADPGRRTLRRSDASEPEPGTSSRRRRRGPPEPAPAEPEAAAAPEASEGDSPRRRRRRTSDADDVAPTPEATEASPTAPSADDDSSPRRRRRRAPAEAPPDPEPTTRSVRRRAPEADEDDDAPVRRRRTRDDDDDEPTTRRRRRAPADGSDDDDEPTTRRRLRRAPEADDEPAGPPSDDTDALPRRRRRRRPDDA